MPEPTQPHVTIVGALQAEGAWHLSSGLAVLCLYEDSIEIRARWRFLRFLWRPWHCLYSDLTEVQPINVESEWRGGIRFKMRDSVRWVIFFTGRLADVTEILAARGVKVNAPIRTGFLTPGS